MFPQSYRPGTWNRATQEQTEKIVQFPSEKNMSADIDVEKLLLWAGKVQGGQFVHFNEKQKFKLDFCKQFLCLVGPGD